MRDVVISDAHTLEADEMPPIRVPLSPRRIQDLYDVLSSFYDAITRYEGSSRQRALEIAAIRESEVVLEVGCGTGKALVEIAERVRSRGEVVGLDIAEKMLKRARESIQSDYASGQVHLLLGEIGSVPFQNNTFDAVFGSYLFDLIDTPRIPQVLSEFGRVLKSSGRMVLVCLSRGSKWYDNMRLYELAYGLVPTLLGGCRPVQLSPYLQKLKFKDITRQFMHTGHLMPTEIVSARVSD